MITNINYKGKVSKEVVSKMNFPVGKPSQVVDKSGKYTIIFFQSGSCRIMGCKKLIEMKHLQYDIQNIQLQSMTVVVNLKQVINLYTLARSVKCMYEPELFPALRLTKYNPTCVNIFASGKVVILGLKSLYYQNQVDVIMNDLQNILQSSCNTAQN